MPYLLPTVTLWRWANHHGVHYHCSLATKGQTALTPFMQQVASFVYLRTTFLSLLHHACTSFTLLLLSHSCH